MPDRLSSDARLCNDRDDPARRVARPNFHHRTDKRRDERSLYRHGRLLAAMLVIATASRNFWIRRLESLHVDQAAARETVPSRQRMHSPSGGLRVNDPVGRCRRIKAFASRCVCGTTCPLMGQSRRSGPAPTTSRHPEIGHRHDRSAWLTSANVRHVSP
jgi:hypothetical protein